MLKKALVLVPFFSLLAVSNASADQSVTTSACPTNLTAAGISTISGTITCAGYVFGVPSGITSLPSIVIANGSIVTNTQYLAVIGIASPVSTLTNYGTLTSTSSVPVYAPGIEIYDGGSINLLRNFGTISGTTVCSQCGWAMGIANQDNTITTLVNESGGLISATNNGIIDTATDKSGAEAIYNGRSITTLTNSGSLTAQASTGYAAGIWNDTGAILTSMTNTGTINATTVSGLAYGIINQGLFSTLVNSGTGTISGGTNGVLNDTSGSITTLTNQGNVSAGAGSYGIRNKGTITTLNNAQNGLTYTGALPTNYNIILNSTSTFGRLVGTNVTGSAIFGLSNLSAWTPSNYTFTSVLSGLSASNIASSSLTGNYGGYKWSLLLENGSSTVWDLKFEASVIGAGSTNSLSDVSGSSPITVAGGTLQATSNSTITAPVTLTGSSNSTINASGNSTVFSSAITSTGSGKLVLADSTGGGAITLNATNNVIAGGVALTSGTLAVGDGSNPNAKLQADVGLNSSSILKGHGTIVGVISNNGGTVRPGGSIGTLAVSGSYNQTASSTLSIEINPSESSQLSVYGTLGKANLNGTLEIVATPGTYAAKKYTMVTTTGGVVGSFSNLTNNLASFTNLYSAVSYDAMNVYLTIYGFTLADTQSSIVEAHRRLINLFDYQTTLLSNSLEADCPVFDKNGGCVSVSGRYSTAVSSSNSAASESGILTLAFKLNDNFRIGAYVDQTVSAQTLYGIKVSNTLPTFGIFGVWAPTPGNAGFSVRVSAGYSLKDLKIARSTVGTSEAGIGSSSLATKGARTVIGYDVPITAGLTIAPYLGARYERQDLGSYTEAASATVTAPLTYASLGVDRAAAIGGGRLSGKIGQSFGLFTDLGVEYDLLSVGGALSASGVTGLTSVTPSSGGPKVRPIGSVGAYYDLAKNQRVSLSANYRKEVFQSSGSASTVLTYALGF